MFKKDWSSLAHLPLRNIFCITIKNFGRRCVETAVDDRFPNYIADAKKLKL